MSGFLYRGRHCGDKPARPRSIGPTMDFSCDETDKGPPVHMHSLREFEQHLNDLKKENFSLKLRIYFLEEKIQQKFEESSDDVHKRNIELKVEVESLKKELEEKQELMDNALLTAELLSNQSEAELQRRLAERQEEISHMQEILETKVQLLQEEAELARADAQRMASLADSETQRCLALEKEMENGGADGLITHQALLYKDRVIEELKQEKHSLSVRVEDLEVKVHDLRKREQSSERVVDEQQSRLSRYEDAAAQCVNELNQAQNQVRSLQNKIRLSETRNQKLQERLGEMELELRSAREEAQQQERNLQNISDTMRSKEDEAAELYRVIEEQNRMLCSLRELTNRSQMQQLQVSGSESLRGQGEVLALQASLFQAQLDLQAGQRAQRQASRTQEDLNRALQRLEKDLQGALQHRRETQRHNQELQMALEKARSDLQEREEQLNEAERERKREEEERETKIREMKTSLDQKDQLIQEYTELMDEPKDKRDGLLVKLRQRIKDRDRALERAVDEKFRCVEEKDEQIRQLQLLLREKDRDVERQRCVLTNNQETISSLEVLVRGKSLELDQVCEAWRNVQQQGAESEEHHRRDLRERDAIISQLQTALHGRTQEAQDLRCSLLTQVQSSPRDVLEELKVRLQLKDRLFQEVLADRTRQAQEHQDQVQDLLRTISSRDQYIQESSGRLGEVMEEQTSRLQELRRQLSSAPGPGPGPGPGSGPGWTVDLDLDLQAVQEELRLALRRNQENQDLIRTQTTRLESMGRSLRAKDDIIRDLQIQTVNPPDLPLVQRLTRELLELKESLAQRYQDQDRPLTRGPVLGLDLDRPSGGGGGGGGGGRSSDDEDEADEDLNSEFTDEDEASRRRSSVDTKGSGPDGFLEDPGLLEVKQLVEQKRAVERELMELKVQLEKTGFHSLSQIRNALFSLRDENERLKEQLSGDKHREEEEQEEEEEELDVTIEGAEEEEEEGSELWDTWDHEDLDMSERTQMKKTRQIQVDAHLDPPTNRPQSKTVHLQKQRAELEERLMVSEATVQVQAEQLKDYRDLLMESAVQQDSKQIQVDLQDLGYETSGRSENEAEREDTSSPEFDDLEMCTSLDCGSNWWPANGSSSSFSKTSAHGSAYGGEEGSSLQRLVEDLRSQLTRSQAVIRGLRTRLRSISTSTDLGRSAPRKVNWSEDDEGWQSSDGGRTASPRHPRPDKNLQELVSRVDALEDQLRNGGGKEVGQDARAATWPGKFGGLIQSQARELSHLRQRLREGRGVCHILTQHLGDTTKAFEELLRANDIDYYMGQSFRDQLAQSSALAHRVYAKISARDHPEDPDDKTELLAIRLSKELQQKDKLIDSLRAKLNQNRHHPQRSDTPCSGHALSDQSDRISYVSDEQGSTNEDLELGSDVDANSDPGQEETRTRGGTGLGSVSASVSPPPSVPPSIASCLSCPIMHCSTPPPHLPDLHSHSLTGFPVSQSKPLPGFPLLSHPPSDSSFLPLSYPGLRSSPFSADGLDPVLTLKTGTSLLESSALWDTAYTNRPVRVGADLSSGSSGYQSGPSHTGSDLMKEHLREIRTLRQRLEDSIQTNDRLRLQLEDQLGRTAANKGAPTNIYIQGLDSMGQLSNEIRILKEENISLQNRIQQATREGSKEAERLREAALLDQARLKEAELEAEKWAEQSRKAAAEADSLSQEVIRLKQERQRNVDAINRLQHEVNVLQQQLKQSRSLGPNLQRRVQGHHGIQDSAQISDDAVTFDPTELQLQLERQLKRQTGGGGGSEPRARRQLFNVRSPPVRDTGLSGPEERTQEVEAMLEGDAPDGCFSNRRGRHAVGHVDHFKALQQQILEGGAVLRNMEATVQTLAPPTLAPPTPHQSSDSVMKLRSDSQTLRQILQEAESLLRMFWRAALPSAQDATQNRTLEDQVVSLRRRLLDSEQALKDAMETVKNSNRTKDSMEAFIVSQLSRTRDVLRTAKTNLQVKTPNSSVSSSSLLVGVS